MEKSSDRFFDPTPDALGKIFHDMYDKVVTRPDDAPVKSRVSAYAIVFDGGKLLFTRGKHSGKLELPGGGMKEGESVDACIRREGIEETGYPLKRLGGQPVLVTERQFYMNRNDTYYRNLLLIYAARVDGFPPKGFVPDQREVESVEWVVVDDLDTDDVHPAYLPAVRVFLQISRGLML